eukprot:3622780-Pyramimonas_sp.AAC.1
MIRRVRRRAGASPSSFSSCSSSSSFSSSVWPRFPRRREWRGGVLGVNSNFPARSTGIRPL